MSTPTTVSSRIPTSRPSDDLTLPFTCENCETEYADFPALIVVETEEETLRYCTDACAEAAGWTQAVVRRYESELSGVSLSIVFIT